MTLIGHSPFKQENLLVFCDHDLHPAPQLCQFQVGEDEQRPQEASHNTQDDTKQG